MAACEVLLDWLPFAGVLLLTLWLGVAIGLLWRDLGD